jgi:hypothetical protein
LPWVDFVSGFFAETTFFYLINNTLNHEKKATTIRVSYEKADQNRLSVIYEEGGVGVPIDSKLKLFKIRFSLVDRLVLRLYFINEMMEVYG